MAMKLKSFLSLLVVAPMALADLPVHCLRHQVAGDWEFTLGPMSTQRSSCGHSKPDSQEGQPPMSFLTSMGATTTKKISLGDPDTATSDEGGVGTWTMIYDEGFEVALSGLNYFAFSKFSFVTDPVKGRTNVSHCDQTQVGWYHNEDRSQWGCYVAKKVGATGDSPASGSPKASLSWMSSSRWSLAPDSALAVSDVTEGSQDSATMKTPDNYKPWIPGSAGFDKPMTQEWSQTVADRLNLLQLGWHAKAYHHFMGKTPRELNKIAGIRRSVAKVARPSAPSSFLGLRSKIRRASQAPDTLNWASKDGQNWLTPVVTQGDCGSCYTISTVNMLTARNRIQQNNPSAERFSIMFPLYCSEYNQGCDGGYGFLQSKWSEDVGLVPESCAPFAESGSCQTMPGCNMGSQKYRATNHHYVGGYYGASEEEAIKQELTNGGPIVMSFEPKEDFMYYKNGVYKSVPNRIHQEWEQVDHAVLLVGYGDDAGQPYWLLQNSWGGDWGENGFFRMARGSDESGCESIVVAADVIGEPSNPVLESFIAGTAA